MTSPCDPILLIEDEPSVTAFVRAALERRGYVVVPAASGAEGLERQRRRLLPCDRSLMEDG